MFGVSWVWGLGEKVRAGGLGKELGLKCRLGGAPNVSIDSSWIAPCVTMAGQRCLYFHAGPALGQRSVCFLGLRLLGGCVDMARGRKRRRGRRRTRRRWWRWRGREEERRRWRVFTM